jgi:hypothetical protein
VIDVHGEEALVVTCAHIFRSSHGRGTVTVDLFGVPPSGPIPGKLISHDYQRDVALVSIRPPQRLEPVEVAAADHRLTVGEPVFTIGCNQGGEPSLSEGRVNAINKYLGPENLTVSGRPVDGRSGGGLFSADGRLIGVCYAADPDLDEGLYAALPRIFTELDRSGLAFVYRRQGAADSPIATDRPERDRILAAEVGADVSTANLTDITGTPGLPDWEQTEIVCVLRSKTDHNARSRVIVLDRPSPQFMQQLSYEYRQAQTESQTAAR